jgi:putative oxidoreductase
MSFIVEALARIFLAVLFVVSGIEKLMDIDQAGRELVSADLPAQFAIPTGAFELIAGVLLAIGLFPRLVPLALIVFVALATLFYHYRIDDPVQAVQAMKNLAIVGGLLAVIAHATLHRSYAVLRAERAHEGELRRAEDRVAAAERRADRAEAEVDVRDRFAPVPPPPRRWFWQR